MNGTDFQDAPPHSAGTPTELKQSLQDFPKYLSTEHIFHDSWVYAMLDKHPAIIYFMYACSKFFDFYNSHAAFVFCTHYACLTWMTLYLP